MSVEDMHLGELTAPRHALGEAEAVRTFVGGLEKIWAEDGLHAGLGKQVLGAYREPEDVSRDIVDENDENFSVKFELVYTMGSQQPVEMSPDRWVVIGELMAITAEVVKQSAHLAPAERMKGLLFEEDPTSGRFPTIRVLKEATGKRFIDSIATQICRTGLSGFQIQNRSKQTRQAVFKYISVPDLVQRGVDAVESDDSGLFKNNDITKTLSFCYQVYSEMEYLSLPSAENGSASTTVLPLTGNLRHCLLCLTERRTRPRPDLSSATPTSSLFLHASVTTTKACLKASCALPWRHWRNLSVPSRSTGHGRLRRLSFLDVDAQITELENLQVAQRWLDLVPSKETDAVVFFDDQDELSVFSRNCMIDPFLTSTFTTQTDRWLIFLDQSHTRGTDLKLPDSYPAAVLTGPWVAEEALIQGMNCSPILPFMIPVFRHSIGFDNSNRHTVAVRP
jgi:hypothetical protein